MVDYGNLWYGLWYTISNVAQNKYLRFFLSFDKIMPLSNTEFLTVK